MIQVSGFRCQYCSVQYLFPVIIAFINAYEKQSNKLFMS